MISSDYRDGLMIFPPRKYGNLPPPPPTDDGLSQSPNLLLVLWGCPDLSHWPSVVLNGSLSGFRFVHIKSPQVQLPSDNQEKWRKQVKA